jgi:hypothetical protein
MFNNLVTKIFSVMRSKNYVVFTRPYELNLIFVRTSQVENAFDDFLLCIYKTDRGEWVVDLYECTTDPGWYYRQNPINPKGTGYVKPGQYINSHTMGLHKGKEAFVQCGNITVYRDNDKDLQLEPTTQETGSGYGQDIHCAVDTEDYVTMNVDKWSAMCFVIADRSKHKFLMSVGRRHVKKYGKLSTTLLTEQDIMEIQELQ